MKKLLTILLVLFCGWAMAQTGENPPSGTKMLQAPNSPTFLFYQPDTSIWISMGAYGKAELQRANKKYPIWNHTGISNVGWSPTKVLGFDVNGYLVPVAAGSGSMTYPAAGIALSNGSGWATSLTDNSAIWNKAIYSDATFSGTNYLLKTADNGRKAVASGIYEDGSGNVSFGNTPILGKVRFPAGSVIFNVNKTSGNYIYLGGNTTSNAKIWTDGTNDWVGFDAGFKIQFNTPTIDMNATNFLVNSRLKFYAGLITNYSTDDNYSVIAYSNDWTTPFAFSGRSKMATQFIFNRKTGNSGAIYLLANFMEAGVSKFAIDGNGRVGIKNETPTSFLHLPAGTATASTAPLKFTSGTNLTAPEAGAMEFDGSRLYFTPSTARKTLSFDENFKTINGSSILGSGDLTVSASYLWGMQVNGGTVENTYDGNVWNLIPGTNISISRSGKDVTFSSTGGSMVYPGAGIPVSTGSAWGTSITDNSANWNTAASNIGQVAVGAQYPGGALGYLASSSFSNFNGIVYVKTATTLDYSSLPVEAQAVSHALSNYSASTHTHSNATTSAAGFMSATDKTNHDAAYSNMGKVKLFGTSTYGELSANFFEWSTNSFRPIRDGSPQENSLYPITSGGVYTALQAKANLSGATFTGAISGTSASFSSTVTASDFQLSDRRLKKDIRPLKEINWANQIDFVSYRMKNDPSQRLRYGVIAQDVEKYAPELVNTAEDGTKSVSYIDLLIAKNQNLQNQINFLKYENMFSICLSCFLFIVAVFARAKRS